MCCQDEHPRASSLSEVGMRAKGAVVMKMMSTLMLRPQARVEVEEVNGDTIALLSSLWAFPL